MVKRHVKDRDFNPKFQSLPQDVQSTAVRSFKLLHKNPRHPSSHFKCISRVLWSIRIGSGYRALAIEGKDLFQWFWIGTHAEYDRLLRNS